MQTDFFEPAKRKARLVNLTRQVTSSLEGQGFVVEPFDEDLRATGQHTALPGTLFVHVYEQNDTWRVNAVVELRGAFPRVLLARADETDVGMLRARLEERVTQLRDALVGP